MITSRKTLLSPLMAGLLVCSALTLAGCGLNREPPPRYNTVVGEKRAPVLNPNGQGYSGLPYASAPPYPIPPGPPPYPQVDEVPLEDTVSVVPMPNTPQTMGGLPGPAEEQAMQGLEPMPVPPQEKRSWYSGVTDWFGGSQEDAMEQHAELPHKAPQENIAAYEEQHGVSAVPVPDVAASDMPPTPPAPEEGVAAAEMPPPMTTDGQGYPVLAETPPAPVNPDAQLAEAQAQMQAMQAQQAEAANARATQQEDSGEAYAPPPAPMPAPVAEAPAEWHPVGEPAPVTAPAPAEAPQQAQVPDWQPVVPPAPPTPVTAAPQPVYVAAPAPEPIYAPPPAPEPAYVPAPMPMSEPVQVMQEVPATSVAADDGLPPINLMPPSSVAVDSGTAARASSGGNYHYMSPSRYDQRREMQRLSPYRQ